jgi:hypothetical protein
MSVCNISSESETSALALQDRFSNDHALFHQQHAVDRPYIHASTWWPIPALRGSKYCELQNTCASSQHSILANNETCLMRNYTVVCNVHCHGHVIHVKHRRFGSCIVLSYYPSRYRLVCGRHTSELSLACAWSSHKLSLPMRGRRISWCHYAWSSHKSGLIRFDSLLLNNRIALWTLMPSSLMIVRHNRLLDVITIIHNVKSESLVPDDLLAA